MKHCALKLLDNTLKLCCAKGKISGHDTIEMIHKSTVNLATCTIGETYKEIYQTVKEHKNAINRKDKA